jgi:hypothetical protein
MNLNHVFFKVGRRTSHKLFSFYVFLNPHALGYPKSFSVFIGLCCFPGLTTATPSATNLTAAELAAKSHYRMACPETECAYQKLVAQTRIVPLLSKVAAHLFSYVENVIVTSAI